MTSMSGGSISSTGATRAPATLPPVPPTSPTNLIHQQTLPTNFIRHPSVSGCRTWFDLIKDHTFTSTFCTLDPSEARVIVEHWEARRRLIAAASSRGEESEPSAELDALLTRTLESLGPLKQVSLREEQPGCGTRALCGACAVCGVSVHSVPPVCAPRTHHLPSEPPLGILKTPPTLLRNSGWTPPWPRKPPSRARAKPS
mmetsp:Transcript_69006/g.192849  ORF Transcript_69006/g.192849 Transcript_69006/m.192849 type:complete len:200 (-) Transcript_69006:381-980(-)